MTPEHCTAEPKLRMKLLVPVVVKYGSDWIGRNSELIVIAPVKDVDAPFLKVAATGEAVTSSIP